MEASVPIMAVLAVLEIPVNRLAFEFFFEETPLLSFALAAGVGAILLLIAHFIGLLARRLPAEKSFWGTAFSSLVIAVLLAFAITMIYVVALVRQHFVDFLQQEQAFSLSELLKSGQIGKIAATLANVSLGPAGYTLLLLNLMIFSLGMLFAFFRHDPNPDYERAVRAKEKHESDLGKAQVDFEKRSAGIDKQYTDRLSFLDQRIDQIEAQVSGLNARLAAVQESGAEALALVRNVIQQRLFAYQAGNEEARRSPRPSYFAQQSIEYLKESIKEV